MLDLFENQKGAAWLTRSDLGKEGLIEEKECGVSGAASYRASEYYKNYISL